MIVKLLTEHHLEFLSFKGGCRVSSESTRVKMLHRMKSRAKAPMFHCFGNYRAVVYHSSYVFRWKLLKTVTRLKLYSSKSLPENH